MAESTVLKSDGFGQTLASTLSSCMVSGIYETSESLSLLFCYMGISNEFTL